MKQQNICVKMLVEQILLFIFFSGTYQPTPRWLQRRRATLNVKPLKKGKNSKNCFLLACYASFHPNVSNNDAKIRNKERLSHYKPYFNQLTETDISIPLRANQLNFFETQNPTLSVNIYAIDTSRDDEKKVIYPWRISKQRGEEKKVINLLILPQKENDDENYHIILITDLGRLIRPQATNHKGVYWACPYCMTCIIAKDSRKEQILLHTQLCSQKDPMHVQYPSANNKLTFNRVDTCVGLSHFIVFDTETRETKKAGPKAPTETRLPPEAPRVHSWIRFPSEQRHVMGDPSSEVKNQRHGCRKCSSIKPCPYIRDSNECYARLQLFSLGYQVVHTHSQETRFGYHEYFGEEEIESNFLGNLKEDLREVKRRQMINVPINSTPEERSAHMAVQRCQLCNHV